MTSSERTHWFEELADHLGAGYLRYSFTKGTEQEAGALVQLLGLSPGDTVLDVGCGPGRHVAELARRGMRVVGLDVAETFLRVGAAQAPSGAHYVRGDARVLPFGPVFDAVISLCQGGFGLLGAGEMASVDGGSSGSPVDPDGVVLEQIARVLRPGGRVALSAFSAYFQLRWLEDGDTFDADTGVNHERTEIRSETGEVREVDLWTSCFTPRELRLLSAQAGLEAVTVCGVTPGDYADRAPGLDRPELLLIARRP